MFDRLRAAVMADTALQCELARIYDPAVFERRFIQWAAGRGVELRPDQLRPMLGVRRPADMEAHWPPAGWLPSNGPGPGSAGIDWLHFAGEPLDRPFFEEACARVAYRPFNRLFRRHTPLDNFVDEAPEPPNRPDGFIFHMSRCGSTLVSRMLGAPERYGSVSEASPIDQMVQLPGIFPDTPHDTHVAALRAIVSAYGQGSPARWFVKLDSWHTAALPLFRQAFPDVPWIFLHRDPVEVIVSQLRMRGQQTVPGLAPAALLGLGPQHGALKPAEFIAHVLDRTCRAVLDHWSLGGGLLVDYRELPEALFTRILPHFGVPPDAAAGAAMDIASRQDAKAPEKRFVPDAARKQREAQPEAGAAAALVAGTYAELRTLRAGVSAASSPR